MPRYCYLCTECSQEQIISHGMNDVAEKCTICGSENTLSKQFTSSFFHKLEQKKEEKVGKKTIEYIEANREVLKQMKEEARKQEYE